MDRAVFVKRMTDSRVFFGVIVVFVAVLAVFTAWRAGKDLKVGLYGVHQVATHQSPYDNPLDPPRPLYRYAPGFALLQSPFYLESRMEAPFRFGHMGASIIAWYMVSLAALFCCGFFLLRLSPSGASVTHLKLSFLMAMPLIGYELSNGQNKLVALALMLAAVFFFENNKKLLSGVFFNLALTVYVPLLAFLFYFILRSRGRYVVDFVLGVFLVFLILPSAVLGFDVNAGLLKDWFSRCLEPFFLTNSYQTYIDLRSSSQSLPSAVGRLLVSGTTDHFRYLISPQAVHLVIKGGSALLVVLSCLAVWRHPSPSARLLGGAVFLILALILPPYCIYYTWAWLWVVYFAVFTYVADPATRPEEKKLLVWLVGILLASSWLIGVDLLNNLSFLFWATLILWGGLVFILLRRPHGA